jgi:hypothetical protein
MVLLHFSESPRSVARCPTISTSTAIAIAGKRERHFPCAAAGKSEADFRRGRNPLRGELLNVICDAKEMNYAMLGS